MIVDCHTHIWADPEQLGAGAADFLLRQGRRQNISAAPADHALAARCAQKTLVLALVGPGGCSVPNEYIAQHVRQHSDTMLGMAGINPADPDATGKARDLLAGPDFDGLVLSPASQGFHPTDSRAMKIYELACELKAPIFLLQGTHLPRTARMEYARPSLLDEVAIEFPQLTLVVSNLGHPWMEECIALIGKHERVFADVAGSAGRNWQTYNSLMLAHHCNVMDKLLFGSDFPFCTAAEAIEGFYRLHELTQGTNLPSVPREALRSIVERDSLHLLGLAAPAEQISASDQDDAEISISSEDLGSNLQ